MPMFASFCRQAAAAALLLVLPALAGPAMAAPGVFAQYGGSWSGGGHVRLEGGRSEALRCSANYVPRAGGAALGLSLRCASAGNRIELRASLTSSGSRVSGSWEERSYNASGGVSGVASANRLRLSISGGMISGVMVVTTSGKSQSISVRTDSTALRGVNISLRRN
jgi:hypothetical protein